jgi:hypothetical protein
MNISVSDMADRYSICQLKKEHGHYVDRELMALDNALKNYTNISVYILRLKEINKRIWDLESDIRLGKENELGLEEVGRRAIMIRNINNERIAIKNEIVDKYDEGFKETKLTTKFNEEKHE